jgi:hypothetical protein
VGRILVGNEAAAERSRRDRPPRTSAARDSRRRSEPASRLPRNADSETSVSVPIVVLRAGGPSAEIPVDLDLEPLLSVAMTAHLSQPDSEVRRDNFRVDR